MSARDASAASGHRRSIIEEAKLCYAAHWEQMLLAYPHLSMTPWDDQDAAVREAWIEHVTPEGAAPLPPCPHCGATEAPERMDSPLRKLTFLIVRADEHTRDPIDLNYVAIPRDAWEDILAVVKRG